jgi:hypothetical protein
MKPVMHFKPALMRIVMHFESALMRIVMHFKPALMLSPLVMHAEVERKSKRPALKQQRGIKEREVQP